jgi:indolepyruvate ferredoxin oxidoreductase
MVGYAYQRGLIPVSEAAILKAIELNGAAIESNTTSFRWGRLAAVEPARVAAAAITEVRPESQRLSESLDEMIERRVKFLTDYQDAAYAQRYSARVAQVREAEARAMPGVTDLTEAVARYHFKLLAIKDEYEVARLYAESDFVSRVAAQFEGDYKLTFNLAPPIFNKPDPVTGVPKKSVYGPWMLKAFGVLAKMRKYRGTALDVFGRTAERKSERTLLADYEKVVDEIVAKLSPRNHATAVELASVPEHIRGYGHVKDAHVKTAKMREAALLSAFRSPETVPKPAVVKLTV